MTLYVYQCDRCGDITPTVVLRNTRVVPDCRHHGGDFPMTLVTDKAVLLPMDQPTPTLAPLKVQHLKAAGILLPETQDALDWLWRHRATNGMAGAFLKVGGRRCIDLVAFAKLMRERRA